MRGSGNTDSVSSARRVRTGSVVGGSGGGGGGVRGRVPLVSQRDPSCSG